MNTISEFEGEYLFLGNFYRCPVYMDGIQYRSSECAYQAQKTLDNVVRQQIAKLTPRQIWAGTPPRGNKYSFDVRTDWELVKNDAMYRVVLAKFTQNEELRIKLLATGEAKLVEGNTWHDNYWGDCSCDKCRGIEGKNMLGKTLMRVREQLR